MENIRKYDESSIQHYEGLQAIREKPTMYIGNIGVAGTFHLFKEVIGNVIDEFNAGRATKAIINIDSKSKFVTITDDGTGIPIGKFEEVISKVHTSGKYNRTDSGAYHYSLGINGVGVKCVNALSDIFIVDTYNNGKHGHAEYRKGVKKELTITDDRTGRKGTIIKYRPDVTVLKNTSMDYEYYRKSVESLTYINPGFKIVLDFDENPHVVYMHSEGMGGYLKSNIIGSRKYRPLFNIITFNDETHIVDESSIEIPDDLNPGKTKIEIIKEPVDMTYEVHFTWCDNLNSEWIESYANSLITINNGTHVVGYRTAITKSILKYIENKNYLPKNSPFTINGDDIRECLVGVLLIQHSNILYETQTKTSVSNTNIQYWIAQSLFAKFYNWLINHPKESDLICKLIIRNAKARYAASQARNKIKGISNNPSALLSISRYEPCRSRNSEEMELFIVEGDSAGGSAKTGRNAYTQAIYKMMGKPLNVYGNKNLDSIEKRSGINTIGDLMKIVGRDGTKFNKYIIMADADPDGSHITSLLLGFFFTFRPDLIQDGYVYVANPPLYGFEFNNRGKKKSLYISTEEDYNRIVENAIMKDFDLIAYDDKTKKTRKITNKKFYNQYLINLRNYSVNVETVAKQLNVRPALLESIILNYDSILAHKRVRIDSWEMEVYFDKNLNCYVLEGIYENIFHKVEMTNFFISQCMKLVPQIIKIKWSNLYLLYKKNNKRLGPGLYKISSGIENAIRNSAHITRFKGLGEMNPNQLWETTMNPETRTLTKVSMYDKNKDIYVKELDMMLGNDINARKDYYRQYLGNN